METSLILARQVAESKERLIIEAIDKELGPNWIFIEVLKRLKRVISFDSTETETILLDEKPILVFGQVELEKVEEGDKTMLVAKVNYKQLN